MTIGRYGTSQVILSDDKEAVTQQELLLDLILITIPDKFDVNPYVTDLTQTGWPVYNPSA